MTIEEANIIVTVEQAAGMPLADLPTDSEWWAVYDELINELNKEEGHENRRYCKDIKN